jgi:transcription termination factor Rho
VVATTLAGADDEGEAERAVITTESSLVVMSPELAAAGAHPSIDPAGCRVSNEEALRSPEELEAVRRLRELLAAEDAAGAARLLTERISSTASNAELLGSL